MTYQELFASAVDCARAAKEHAHRHDGERASEAWSRAGELFLQLAEHQYGMDVLKPRPAPDRDTLVD